nr:MULTISPECIES: ComF family protein [unclassified Halomonas]
MTTWLGRIEERLRQALPGYCAFCQSNPASEKGWCDECQTLLPHNPGACPMCAEPRSQSPTDSVERLCGHCLIEPPAMARTTADFLYTDPVKTLVRDFKYHASTRAGVLLVELMLTSPPDTTDAALMGVPMHPAKARERGFNQADWLARQLARRLGLASLEGRCVKRLPAQHTLNRRARLENLRGAFIVPQCLPERLIIVDDVVTTGATGHELARQALKAGARRVELWAPARTPRGRDW